VRLGHAYELPGQGQYREPGARIFDLDVHAAVVDHEPIEVRAVGQGAGHALHLDLHRPDASGELGGDEQQTPRRVGQEVQRCERQQQGQRDPQQVQEVSQAHGQATI